MTSLIWGLIEINVLIMILFIGYMVIRKRLSFSQQRAVLLGLPFLAIGAVLLKSFVDISNYSYSLSLVEIVQLEQIIVGGNDLALATSPWSLISIGSVYWMGVIGFGLLFVYRIAKVLSFFGLNFSEKQDAYRIYKVKGKASFSFFYRIQISPELSESDQEIVLEHEKTHAKKRHSLDHIVLEICHAFFWFNPIFFFIKREMVNLHEFEVDALMYKKHKVNYIKFLLSYVLGMNSSHYLLTSRFYNRLTLKKRINTMKTKNKKRLWLLSFIPLLAICATLIQCVKTEEPSGETPAEFIPESEEVFDFVDVEPEFIGGQLGMSNFIVENITYPQIAKDNGVEGIVYVQFVVSKNGAIIDPSIRKGVDANLDAEALRVVAGMPNWKPGEVDGEAVAVKFTLPISFKLS